MATLFSDIDFNFIPHPVTGDISILKNEAAIKKSVMNLVQTGFYERLFKHEIGSNVGRLLFELSSPFLVAQIEQSIYQVIENYEPRVTLDSVQATLNDDEGSVSVDIYYKIVGTLTPLTVNITLERTR